MLRSYMERCTAVTSSGTMVAWVPCAVAPGDYVVPAMSGIPRMSAVHDVASASVTDVSVVPVSMGAVYGSLVVATGVSATGEVATSAVVPTVVRSVWMSETVGTGLPETMVCTAFVVVETTAVIALGFAVSTESAVSVALTTVMASVALAVMAVSVVSSVVATVTSE